MVVSLAPRLAGVALAMAAAALAVGCASGGSRLVAAGPQFSAPSTSAPMTSISPGTSAGRMTRLPISAASATPPTTTMPARTVAHTPPKVTSVLVDAGTATATITFDQPVMPGTGTLAPLYFVVFGADARCATPEGNGHEFLRGAGTASVTVSATSLVAGANYVTIATGFVTAAGGTPSEPLGCTRVMSATAPIPPTTTTLPADAPTYRSAVADPAAGTITVTFDQPVGAGSALDLVVYGNDSTCAMPAGNAQAFVTGTGTPTVTATATSLAGGTTYITIASGWITSASALRTPNKPLACTAVPPARS